MPDLSQKFGPLVEEYDATFVPEVTYVRQGNKVFFARGSRVLTEAVDEATTHIVESIEDLELVEREGKKFVKDGHWFVEGPYQRSDVENANKRIYGRKIWERLIGDANSTFMQAVKAGGTIGHLEHPKDGRTDGNLGAQVHRDFKLRPDGIVWGVSELLDTPSGLILQEYSRKGVRWGQSSRGNGSVNASGKVNEADFNLETFDAVMRPSTPGAYPKTMTDPPQQVRETSDTVSSNKTTPVVETTPVNESGAESCAQAVNELIAIHEDALDEAGVQKVIGDLITQLGRVNGAASRKSFPSDRANEMHDWLTTKLNQVYFGKGKSVSTSKTTALSESVNEETARKDAAYQRVVRSLQERISDANEAATKARVDLEAAIARAESAEERLERTVKERDAAIESWLKTGGELTEVKKQLEVATAYIQQQSEDTIEDPVALAVEAVIEEHPQLEKHRAIMSKSDDVAALTQLVEDLTASRDETSRPRTTAPRPTLPTGRVISESRIASKPAAPRSAGATAAAGALAKMKPVASAKA